LGINFITVNKDVQYLAICELGDPRAMCTIYDIENDKRKVIPENDYDQDFKTKTFLSCAFSPIHHEHLITLAGEPDW
jgi:hypothetical protein